LARSRLGDSILKKLDSVETSYDDISWDILSEQIKEVRSVKEFTKWSKVSLIGNFIVVMWGVCIIGFQSIHIPKLDRSIKEESQWVDPSSTVDFSSIDGQSHSNKMESEVSIPIHTRTNTINVPFSNYSKQAPLRLLDEGDKVKGFQTLAKKDLVVQEVKTVVPSTLTKIPILPSKKRLRYDLSLGISMLHFREIGTMPSLGLTLRSTFAGPYSLSYFGQADYYSGKVAFLENEVIYSQGSDQVFTRQEVSKDITFQSFRLGFGMKYSVIYNNSFAIDFSAGPSVDYIISQTVESEVKSIHENVGQEPFETLSSFKSNEVDPYFIPGISSSLGLHFGKLNARFGAMIPLSKLKESKQSLFFWETRFMMRLN